MELSMTEIMSVAISLGAVIVMITAIVIVLGEPNYVSAGNMVLWPF